MSAEFCQLTQEVRSTYRPT